MPHLWDLTTEARPQVVWKHVWAGKLHHPITGRANAESLLAEVWVFGFGEKSHPLQCIYSNSGSHALHVSLEFIPVELGRDSFPPSTSACWYRPLVPGITHSQKDLSWEKKTASQRNCSSVLRTRIFFFFLRLQIGKRKPLKKDFYTKVDVGPWAKEFRQSLKKILSESL